jgi:two-component system catabolic regulation response regulator CreB
MYLDTPLTLTRYEFKLLATLMERPGWVFSREQLMGIVWESPDMSLERTVDTHIKTIRAKLKRIDPTRDLITTHRGFGYSLREDV